MAVFNLLGDDWDGEREHPGFSWRYAELGPRLGAEKVGMSLYELAPGQKTFPYHYEYGNEEWLICVAGRPTLRTPEGERELRAGDTVCFPEGPGGAHQVVNGASEPARVLIRSTKNAPGVAVYPDSDKMGVGPHLGSKDDMLIAPRSASVDYWEGEPS